MGTLWKTVNSLLLLLQMQVKTRSCKAKVVDQQHPEMPLTHVLLELKRKQVIQIVPKHLLSVVTGKGDVTRLSSSFFWAVLLASNSK